MKTLIRGYCTIPLTRLPWLSAAASGLLLLCIVASAGFAQSTQPLGFGNNFFVTGDYVVAGVGLRGLGDGSGYATGTISMPDGTTVPSTGVPTGANIVAAYLYWETVVSSQAPDVGKQGFFRPIFTGGPGFYPITGTELISPQGPVAWSSGGCSGAANGTKLIKTYRADVSGLLGVNSQGNVQANGTYEVSLADSGSNGGGTPLTLGATLVIIYRVLDKNVPLKSVIIYDGAYAPANGSSTMTQLLQGFYEPSASPIAKLTQIVGNGQSNKYESVYLGNSPDYLSDVPLPSLYGNGTLPAFSGVYNQNTISPTGGGSWDNPTWIVNNYGAAGSRINCVRRCLGFSLESPDGHGLLCGYFLTGGLMA